MGDNKIDLKMVLVIIVCGTVLALISVLYSQDMTVGLGAKITGYGLPWLWLEKVTTIVPGNPESHSLYGPGLNLLADIAFWIIIVALTYFVYSLIKK